MTIKKTAVLGAGVMGSQIAGHLAGCGVEVLLMDIVPPEAVNGERSAVSRNKLALDGIEKLKKMKPAAMYDADDLRLVTPGNFADDLPRIADCDLVIEVVLERLDIKKKIYDEVEKYLMPGAIMSSNTSGILLSQLTEGRSENFARRFVITHFFNPVRYMKLVELVGGPKTDPDVIKTMAAFLENVLGKGVVYAKDTPNFIANRIGVHSVLSAFEAAEKEGWPIEVIDQVMGPPTARPKSAIFRTADIVGIDTLALVAKNNGLEVPDFVKEMIKRGMVGDKSGGGFYKKAVKDVIPAVLSGNLRNESADSASPPKAAGMIAGERVILAIDPKTLEYRPQQKIKTPSLGAARDIDDPRERLRTVVFADDEAGRIAWKLVSDSIFFASNVWKEIAHDKKEIDNAMKWGFNWELGPFEQLESLGADRVAERLKAEGRGQPVQPVQPLQTLQVVHQNKVIASNAGADLTDLGDGVFACEFHTKMNAIDADVIEMLNRSLDAVEKNGNGLVISNSGTNFSAGANLMMLLIAIQSGEWGQIEKIVRDFQNVNQRIRFSPRPVVAAPFGLTLGGGCEISIASARINAFAETYMGLVEVGVGLVPAGCGCKNMLLRMEERHKEAFDPKNKIWYASDDGGPFPKARDAFQTIAFAKVSTSGKEAKKIGYLKRNDIVTISRDRLFENAKKDVLTLAKNYIPPSPREDIMLPGRGGKMALVNGIRQALKKGDISEHDAVIGEKLAHVLTGGDMESTHKASEAHILDLEREAFLSLCGLPKTVERIQHMLLKGKPLRN